MVDRVRVAITDGVLEYGAFESGQDPAGQPSLLALDLAGPWPDVLQCHFECPRCGDRFALSIETYHPAWGAWTQVSVE